MVGLHVSVAAGLSHHHHLCFVYKEPAMNVDFPLCPSVFLDASAIARSPTDNF
jgi:hypothetical protein